MLFAGSVSGRDGEIDRTQCMFRGIDRSRGWGVSARTACSVPPGKVGSADHTGGLETNPVDFKEVPN